MTFSLFQVLSFVIILVFSIILSLQDIKQLAVGTYIQWLSIFCALICNIVFNRREMWIFILSGMIFGLLYFLVRKISKNKLGIADVWFGFFQGLFLLPQMIAVCIAIETIIALCVINKKLGKAAFPFIPFMSAGLIISYIVQEVFF